MAVVEFRKRSERKGVQGASAGVYHGISQDAKRQANSVVAELHFAITQARTQSPEAMAAFRSTAQAIRYDEDGTFCITIGRAEGMAMAAPIVQFYTSPMDGWVCVCGRQVFRDQSIEKLVARAHDAISEQPGLGLMPISATRKYASRLAHQ